MRKKRTVGPASPPNLLVSKEEAAQKITTQIEKGKDIKKLRVHSDEELELVRAEATKWSDYNIELLTRLFDNTYLAEGYQTGLSLPFEDIFEDQVERFRENVSDGITKLESILGRLPLMTSSNTAPPAADSIRVTREGVFYEGQYYDAFQAVKEILSDAQRRIMIIDAYVNENVLNLLTSKQTTVEVHILTKSVSPALRAAAIAFNKQYKKLSIHTSPAFHDRFLILDDRDFYHFGASIKDLGHRGSMYSRIEEPEVIDALCRKLSQEWARSKVEV